MSRVCFFSSDSYGLGHVMRNVRIANELVTNSDALTALIVTGVGMDSLPIAAEGCDFLKLPAFLRLPEGGHRCVRLRIRYEELRAFRAAVFERVLAAFRPTVLLSDHITKNIKLEIEPALNASAASDHPPIRIMTFDEVLNPQAAVIRDWLDAGLFDFVASHMDEVWVCGDPAVCDWESEYRVPRAFAERLHYMGFVAKRLTEAERVAVRARVRGEFGIDADEYVVVVSSGGGHDGPILFTRYLDAMASRWFPECLSLLVTGPLMEDEDAAIISARCATEADGRARVIRYVPNFDDLMASADAVITMAGSCTPAEAMAAGTPLTIVPRVQWESSQQARAAAFSELGWARSLTVSDDNPRRFAEEVVSLLEQGYRPPPECFDGLTRVTARLRGLALAQ